MDELLSSLNRKQYQAVISNVRAIMIMAGPGTGKTKTLTARIAYLLSQGVPAKDIVALTFTRKAAKEMNERLLPLAVSIKTSIPLITTFHGLASHFLSQLQIPYTVATTDQITTAVNEVAHAIPHLSPRAITNRISYVRSQIDKSSFSNADTELIQLYQEQLKKLGVIDFDELLLLFMKQVLNQNPEVTIDHPSFLHILVDEFQDTSPIQYDIIRRIGMSASVFVIGDPFQSIYSFRGAHPHIFEQFQEDYQPVEKIVFNDNYRSGKQITKISQALIESSDLVAYKQSEGSVSIIETLNEYSESQYVLDWIEELVGGSDLIKAGQLDHSLRHTSRFSDIAVIFRTHSIKRHIQQKLFDSGIPYQIVGGESPFEDRFVNLLIDTLAVAFEPTNLDRINRLLLHPQFPSVTAVELLLPPRDNIPLSVYAQNLITQLKDSTKIDTLALAYFQSLLYRFDSDPLGWTHFFEYVSFLEGHEYYDPTADYVTLLSMHGSKGLEFNNVMIAGCEHGQIPYIRIEDDDVDLDEERRLLYVAMTRAKDTLGLLYPRYRNEKGTQPSSFIKAISPFCEVTIDPAMIKIQSQAKRRQLKKNQQTLF
ncbi:ATP-dependent helicase [candidate division WWE3 bacterium]|nr:ATP-dependent helicase [candidate division WWE3 bacterium]